VEKVVRNTAAILTDGDVQVAALHYIDPERFGDSLEAQALTATYGIKITQENVSVSTRTTANDQEIVYAEDIIPFKSDRRVDEALETAGYDRDEAARFAAKLADILNGSVLKGGTVLRVGLEVRGDVPKIVRVGVYDGAKHTITVALNDKQVVAQAMEPEPNPELLTAFDDSPPVASGGSLPSIYDGIYRAAFSYGMSRDSAKKLIRLLAGEVDLQTRVSQSDRLEVLFSQPDDENEMSDESQLLFVAATFAGKTPIHRFRCRMAPSTISTKMAATTVSPSSAAPCPMASSALASADGAIRFLAMFACTRAWTGPRQPARRSSPPPPASLKNQAGLPATASRRF
jgi:hypothetical protein